MKQAQQIIDTTSPALAFSPCYALPILNILSLKTCLIRCKINKRVFISKICPFCGEKGKRVFRYNTKLKVGKSYCCGVGFKEEYWLKQQLADKEYAHKHQIKKRHGIYSLMSKTRLSEYLKYMDSLEEKLSIKHSRFEKSNDEDENLPF